MVWVPGPAGDVGGKPVNLFEEFFGNIDPNKNYMCPLPSSPAPSQTHSPLHRVMNYGFQGRGEG